MDSHSWEAKIPPEVTKSPQFVESKASLPCLQEPTTGPYREPVESSAYPNILYYKIHLTFFSFLRRIFLLVWILDTFVPRFGSYPNLQLNALWGKPAALCLCSLNARNLKERFLSFILTETFAGGKLCKPLGILHHPYIVFHL